MVTYAYYRCPFGFLAIGIEADAVVSLRLASDAPPVAQYHPLAQAAVSQLQEYFSGTRTCFDLPLMLKGTPFQQLVWQELMHIPYGQTRTYGEIAAAIGKPGAARAVGMACNRNPVWVLIPCHRVVGRNGALTGYAGGLSLKHQLLELEKTHG